MDKYFNSRGDNVDYNYTFCCARLPNLVVDDTLMCKIWKSNFQTYR